ncbi:hypothetical protein [Hafnia paralvei]|uniref:Uncharacterized protein n=1 Tax=Hafnia paralvei TaxID=546367 RepID=A0A4Q9ER97_9GAMM|nr:hypothetical protein [Hafnia paralvei]TBM29919.1 hypothetical protein EYY89_05695 [Hafnia paralvei]
MTNKKFSPEVIERLFIAVEEDDVVDEHASLPPIVDLQCSQKVIRNNYALCLQFWEDGVTRKDLLRLILNQLRNGELSEKEKKQYKYIRARYKHLRFAQQLYRKKHQSGFLFSKMTVFLGRFQDGFRNKQKDIITFYGKVLRVYHLNALVWMFVHYSLRHIQLDTADGFIHYCQGKMKTLQKLISKPLLTGREFHDARKIISQLVSYYDTLRAIDPDNQEALQISRFLAAINGLMGDRHDEMVADDMENLKSYDAPSVLDSDIRARLELLLSRYPL